MSKKAAKWVPFAAALGAVAGAFYLINNSRSVRSTTYRGVSGVAGQIGVELPGGMRDFILAPQPHDPRFGVGIPPSWGRDSWLAPNPYRGDVPGYTPPPGSTFGVRLG